MAIVKTSGEPKKIILPKDNFSKNLKTGLENLANKGDDVIGINVTGTKFFFIYPENNSNGKNN